MTREEFFEQLDEFDWDTIEDNIQEINHETLYKTVQFFANKIYNDLDRRICKNCKYAIPHNQTSILCNMGVRYDYDRDYNIKGFSCIFFEKDKK